MQIRFSTIDRAKKSAKALASVSNNIPLSTAQRAVAKLSGCRDWHDLDTRLKRSPREELPAHSQTPDGHLQIVEDLTLRLSEELGTDWSTTLYAMSIAHLPGVLLDSPDEYGRVWLRLMYRVCEFSGQRKAPGSIVRLKVPGRMGNPGYLRAYGRPTYLVTHRSIDTCVADFEVAFPRKPVEPFIPARLKYAYGCWTEEDGAEVLFSRDYKPLWRLREGCRPERLEPWLWIDKCDETWFWDDVNPPWYSNARQEEEEQRLRDYGITALPKLTDILPEVILSPELRDVADAVDVIAKREAPTLMETYHGIFRMPRSLEERRPI
ncbi:MAG TPA: hypothetical protein DD670_00070 [Planctomycetaceae bacterium]|nr:hypothetical protein [Planctomycetaceae bacterium]